MQNRLWERFNNVNSYSVNKLYSCEHYKRKCQLMTPCCKKIYMCRFCHDENEKCTLDRKKVMQVQCLNCALTQEVRKNCKSCGILFGLYFCHECRLYDDEQKRQFHCDACGICRVGGQENYFHCPKCDCCLANCMKNNHKCVEKASHTDCPLCYEYLHTSRKPLYIYKCGHLIHKHCFEELKSSGHHLCPVCRQ